MAPINLTGTQQPDIPVARDGILLCPICRGGWLHQAVVWLFERKEDSRSTLRVEVSHETPAAWATWSGSADNPSTRRHGLIIRFWCESCGDGPSRWIDLTIAQHKGQTEIAWRGPLIGQRGDRHDR